MSIYQYHFVQNTLKDSLCALCLTQNRRYVVNLSLLQSIHKNFPTLLAGFDAGQDKICWECNHRLKQMLSFTRQVQQARLNLEQMLNAAGTGNMVVLGSLSKLHCSRIVRVNINTYPKYSAGSSNILPPPLHSIVRSNANILPTHPQSTVNNAVDPLATPTQIAEQTTEPEEIKTEFVDKPICRQNQINPLQVMNTKQEIKQEPDDPMQSDDIEQNITKKAVMYPVNSPNTSTYKNADIVKEVKYSLNIRPIDTGIRIIPDLSHNQTLFVTNNMNQKQFITNNVTQKQFVTNNITQKQYVTNNMPNRLLLLPSETSKMENMSAESNTAIQISVSEDVVMQLRKKERTTIKNLGTGFYCDKCIMNIDNAEAFSAHMAQHDEPSAGREICGICKMWFKTVHDLMLHNKEHYRVLMCLQCPRPRFMCRFSTTMERHLKLHAERWLECNYCEEVFETQADLTTHIESTHRVICSKCEGKKKFFRSPQVLADHIRNFHTVFKCEKCHMTLKGRKHQKKHEGSPQCQMFIEGQLHLMDGDGKPYCAVCKVFFKNRYVYVRHMKVSKAHGNVGSKFECDYCGKVYLGKRTLAHHIKAYHDKSEIFDCGECGKKFHVEAMLKRHKQDVHEKMSRPRDKICDFCGKAFTSMQQLKRHRYTHTGERPFQCKLCESNFASHAALWTHNKLKHTDRAAHQHLRDRRKKNMAKKKEKLLKIR